MRFFLLAGVLLTVGLSVAEAQEREFGAKIGPSFSSVSFDPDEGGDYDPRVSADGGGFAVFPMTSRLALQVEAMFTSKGAQAYDPELDLTSTILLQDFDIPALVRITGPTFGSGSIHAFAGPSAGVRLSAKRQLATSDSIGVKYGQKVDMSNEIERFELGFVIGAGVNIGRRFVIDGRYLRGLTSVDTDTADGVKIKNRGFSIMAGGRF